MPNGYISQIQINGGDVQNIGSCAYAVCDTAEDVSVKVVTLPGFVLKDGATIHVKFMYRNTAFNPELNINGTGAKSILLNTNLDFNSSISLSSQYNVDQLWLAGAIVTLTYDGTNWVVNNPSRITTPFAYNLGTGGTLEPDSYMILADIEWERCTSSSNVTARVFPFRICMSTMVDGVYRDRSAIMEVFVGGCYSKKDYVDIMIHDESEYHVNDDNVFRSLIDSIFIYFEYEVSSGNVIGKRTGHLLGKIPARWSVFQLVPLTDMSVASANPDEDHHFLKFDIANSRSSFEPSETSQTSIPSGNVLPTTVGVHKYLIKARMKPFDVKQISGVLPISKGGTEATTAIGAEYNILNQVADINTTLSDTRKIALCNQTKSASNGVFRWIALSNVWNWIKGKADSVYQPVITAGTGLSKTDNTINHSNSVTERSSDLGAYNKLPIIRYDAQGHITYSDELDIYSSESKSTIKCGYVKVKNSNPGWYKVGEVTYWKSIYRSYSLILSVASNGIISTHHYGILSIIGVGSGSTAGSISKLSAKWLVKTSEDSIFEQDCIRLKKTETYSSDGAKIEIYMKLPVSNISFNFQVLNESYNETNGLAKGRLFSFFNSSEREIIDPPSTYSSSMLSINIGDNNSCLTITNDNWSSYMTASNESTSFVNCDILTIPQGYTSVFFATTSVASIACVRGDNNMYPRNGVRLTIAGNWKPQQNGGYAGGNAEGRFSQYIYDYRGGVAGMHKQDRLDEGFEDFMYFNGVWYSKGY